MDANYLATFDTDGQHDAADLARMFETLRKEKADYVLGSRFLGEARGIPWGRRWVLKAGVLFTWVFSGVRLTDAHNGIRVMTKRGSHAIQITMNRMEHASELVDQISNSGLRFVEAPVQIRYTPETIDKGQRSSASVRMAIKLTLEKIFK